MYWLRERIHPMWHVAALCYGVAAGVAWAQWLQVGSAVLCVVAVALAGLALWKRRRFLIVFAVVAGLCLGLVRGSGDQHELTLYRSLYGRSVVLTGTIKDDVTESSAGVGIQLVNVKLGNQALPGQVWVTLRKAGDLRRGDSVTVYGTLKAGFGNYAGTLSGTVQRTQRVVGGDPALEARDGFASAVRRATDEPAASLGIGYLLGKKSTLPDQLLEALKVAGLTHIIVASGYNLTILVRLARRLFAKISKFLAMFVSVGLIGGFIAITGLSPSMTRAGLVTGLSLWAWYYGRKFHPVMLLGLALALTTLWQPNFAWGDVGRQLSFAAFAGVMIVAPIMTAYFFGEKDPPLVGQILLETTAAQLMTVPVLLVTFGQVSVIALLANLLIVPFIPLAMLLTTVAGVGGLLPIGAAFLGWPAQQLLNTMIVVVYWCAEQPWAQLTQSIGWLGALVWYSGLLSIVSYMKWRSGYRLRNASLVA